MWLRWTLVLVPLASACGGASTDREPRSPDAGGARAAGECHKPAFFGPSIVAASTYARRNGHDVTSFAALSTSSETPLEECSLRSVLERLTELTCADGSQPFGGDLGRAHQSRRGSAGAGGRCSDIIDVYDVPCPEATYPVFADMYLCSEKAAKRWRG
jgi:hypothetical protein